MALPPQPLPQVTQPWPAPGGEFTAEDLLDVPSDGHRYEIIDGGLHVAPPTDVQHRTVADRAAAALRSAAPPGWEVFREIGIRIGDSTVRPDLAVLRPGASLGAMWADPADVALAVEVESKASRRHDRLVKASLYAEARFESFWRIERTGAGPVAHLYTGPASGHYHGHRAVNPGDSHVAELPYAVSVAPATWAC